MTLLAWRDTFEIGIPDVDHEHRELVALINTAHASLGAGRDAEQVETFLGEVFAGISAHFALEERVMRERHYDALPVHKTDHERLLDELRDIMDEQADGAALDDARLSQALADWFSGHFRTHDARFHHALVR